MTSSGLTAAPVAGTSPEPQGAGSRGAVPHSCHPHPSVVSPHGPPPRARPLFLAASPVPEERNFLPAPPLSFQRPAAVTPGSCRFRATLRVSSYHPAPLKFPPTTSPNYTEAPSPSDVPRDPQAGEPSGPRGGPTLHPLHLFLGLRPDRTGCACAGVRAAGSLRPQGLCSQTGDGERRGAARQGSGSGSLPPLRRRNPRLSLPVYAAAGPETSELQPLQPIPARPQLGPDTPSCIIHETATFLLHPEASERVPYTPIPTN